MVSRGRIAATLRVVAKILAVALASMVLVVGSLLLALHTDRGRELVCSWSLKAVNQAIPGAIHVERCSALSLTFIRLEGVAILDPSDREILEAEAVEAAPDVLALLEGIIRIDEARVEAPSMRLIDYGDDLAIVSAFVSPAVTTSNEEDETSITVELPSIQLARGTLTDLPEDLSLRDVRAHGSLTYDQSVGLEVSDVAAELTQHDETLVRLWDGAGTMSFGDEARMDVRANLEAQGRQASLDGDFEGSLQSFSLHATSRMLGGQVDLRARNEAGRIHAQLQASDLALSSVSNQASGVARADLEATAEFSKPTPSADTLEHLSFRGDLTLTALVLPEVRARALTLHARAQGRLPTPTVHLVMEANGIEIRGQQVDRLRLQADGHGGQYEVSGRAPLPNGWIVGVNLDSHLDESDYRVDGTISVANSPFSPVVVKVSQLVVAPAESISAHSVSVTGDGLELALHGRYRFHDASNLAFELRSLELARLKEALGVEPELEGQLVGSGRIRGTRERPELEAELSLEDAAIEHVSIDSLQATLGYSTRRRNAKALVQVDFGSGEELSLGGDAALHDTRNPAIALRTASYQARLEVDSLSVSTLARFLDELPTIHGTISSEMTARGKLDDLEVDMTAYGRQLAGASLTPVNAFLEVNLRRGEAHARLEAATEEGSAVVATAAAHLDLLRLVQGASAQSILDEPWELSIRIPEQPVSTLPVRFEIPAPARASLELRAAGGSGSSIHADIDADLRFPVDRSKRSTAPSECPCLEPARIRAHARLRDGQSKVEVEGYVAHEEVLQAGAEVETQLDAWIRHGFPSGLPVAQLRVLLEPVEIGAIPIACNQARGEVRAHLEGSGLFHSSQEISLRLEASELRMRNEDPVHVLVQAEASATEATAQVGIESKEKKLVQLHAHAPVQVQAQASGRPLDLGTGTLSVSADFDDAPLSLILGPVPVVARPSGHLDGHLSASGDAQDLSTLELRGDVQLADASMTLKDPFIRLDEVDADLSIEPDRLVVRSLSARDRDGRVEAKGSIGLAGWRPTDVSLTVDASDYPLRRAGVPMATLNGQVELTGDLGAEPRALQMKLGKEVSLVLPEELQYGVQSLAPHPLVIYEGQPGFDRSLSVEKALAEHRQGAPKAREEGPPLVVHVTSSEPFWVRRPDFSIQLGLDLKVHSGAKGTWLEGEIDIRRGFLVLLTKNFDVKSGTIRFTGATPIDPTVSLRASHRLRSGHTVTIDVEGRVSAPELTFSTDAPNANTNAEIAALLLGVSRQGNNDQQAENQTRSMLAGLTAGLVGSLARRELGQYAPIIAVESEGTAETTRVRAGVTVGDLIPDAWQDVLLGVYVEGMLAGSEQGPRGGFLLELLFPHYLSTTTTYEQPDNWSLDLLWQP